MQELSEAPELSQRAVYADVSLATQDFDQAKVRLGDLRLSIHNET